MQVLRPRRRTSLSWQYHVIHKVLAKKNSNQSLAVSCHTQSAGNENSNQSLAAGQTEIMTLQPWPVSGGGVRQRFREIITLQYGSGSDRDNDSPTMACFRRWSTAAGRTGTCTPRSTPGRVTAPRRPPPSPPGEGPWRWWPTVSHCHPPLAVQGRAATLLMALPCLLSVHVGPSL